MTPSTSPSRPRVQESRPTPPRPTLHSWAWVVLWTEGTLLVSGVLLEGLLRVMHRSIPESDPAQTIHLLERWSGMQLSHRTVVWSTYAQLVLLAVVGFWFAWRTRESHAKLALSLTLFSMLTLASCARIEPLTTMLLGPATGG